MRLWFIRSTAVFLSGLWTIAYLFALYAGTYAYCFGTHPLCAEGWMPRTWITLVYLGALGCLLYLARRGVRWARLKDERGHTR